MLTARPTALCLGSRRYTSRYINPLNVSQVTSPPPHGQDVQPHDTDAPARASSNHSTPTHPIAATLPGGKGQSSKTPIAASPPTTLRPLTRRELDAQLNLSSAADILRRVLLGPQAKLRAKVLNQRVSKGQLNTPHRPSAGRRRPAQPTLDEWFESKHGSRKTRRLRFTDLGAIQDGHLQGMEAGFHSPFKAQEDGTAREYSELQGTSTEQQQQQPEREWDTDKRSDVTLSSDLLRAQIRACRSPEDILRVLTVAFRRPAAPLHPAHPSSARSVEQTMSDVEGATPPSSASHNPAIAFFSMLSMQYAIAESLQRLHTPYRQARALATRSHITYRSDESNATAALACLNTIRHRFRTQQPPILIEPSLIRMALLFAAQLGNCAAVRFWLAEWRTYTTASNIPPDSAHARPLFYRLCALLHQSILAHAETNPPDARPTTALRHILTAPADADASLESFLPPLDFIALQSYLPLLQCSTSAHVKQLYHQFKAAIPAFFHTTHLSSIPPDQVAALAALPAAFADMLWSLGDVDAGWTVVQETALSGLWRGHGEERPLYDWLHGRLLRARDDASLAGTRSAKERLFTRILHRLVSSPMPGITLPAEQCAHFSTGVAHALTNHLQTLEADLGLKWQPEHARHIFARDHIPGVSLPQREPRPRRHKDR